MPKVSQKWIKKLLPLFLTMLVLSSSSAVMPVYAQKKKAKHKTTKTTKTNEQQSPQVVDKGQIFDNTISLALLENYIKNTKNSNQLADISPIKNYFNSLNKSGKQQLLTQYTDKTSEFLQSNNKNDALAIICLYSSLANSNDEKLPTLLYIKGTIYSENLDSVKVKETINELNNLTPPNTQYISALNENLEKIRDFKPPYQELDGEWVALDINWMQHSKKKGSLVNFWQKSGHTWLGELKVGMLMKIINDIKADTMSIQIEKECNLSSQISAKMAKWITKEIAYASQIVIPYAKDSLYICWANEKVDKKNPLVSTFLRETLSTTAAAVNAELAQHNKYDWGTSFFGGLAQYCPK